MKTWWGVFAWVLLGLQPWGWAQGAATSPIGVAHIALRVSDVDREVDFLGKLGFEEAFANAEGGRTTQAFVKVNDRQFIEVYPATAAGEAPGALGLMHLCYEVEDLKALNDRYSANGLKPTAWRKAGAGNLLFNLQDPDGRVTEFTQYMPGSRQMNDAGQHLGANRVSEELLGVEMPAANIETAKTFYKAMGFDAEQKGEQPHLKLAVNPDVQIVIDAASKGILPESFFAVDDLRKAEAQLEKLGLHGVRDKKQVTVRDPDGNIFALIETGKGSSRHAAK